MSNNYARLHPISFALGLGVFWAIVLFCTGIIAMYTGYASGFVSAIGSLYIYYKATWMGSILGAVFGFIDLLIGGFIIAWLYNFFYGITNK